MVSPVRAVEQENLHGRIPHNYIKDRNLLQIKPSTTPLRDAGSRLNIVRNIFPKDFSNASKNGGEKDLNLKPVKENAESEPSTDDNANCIWSDHLAFPEIEDEYQDLMPLSLLFTEKDISNLVYANPGPRKCVDEDWAHKCIDTEDLWATLKKEMSYLAELTEFEMDSLYCEVPEIQPPAFLDSDGDDSDLD